MPPTLQTLPPPSRRHSAASLSTEDALRIQNQVLQAKVLELTETLVKTQYELKLERVNYKHLHRKTLSLETQLEAQVYQVIELEQCLASMRAEQEAATPEREIETLCKDHLNMLHEDIEMYQARCAMYEEAIRELWRTYVNPTMDVNDDEADPADEEDEAEATAKKNEADFDSDDTMSLDSEEDGDVTEEDEWASWQLMEQLCASISDSVEMHQEYLAAITDLEEQLEYDSQKHWDSARGASQDAHEDVFVFEDDGADCRRDVEIDDPAFSQLVSDLNQLLAVAC
ncbi:Aste57867_21763 [Aphanomyces stellatus]|uniref:Aste57867_21763 protein n=1 Tax=Aphanomyces stellatus TaxID=120398 RepID=A0A485LID8_9STRA|nr:hypothetical protein As57867_021694 [Aphanomyces stellatus]VFT98432.1 Aste57867_21763 [Aphanomyces stellatus]